MTEKFFTQAAFAIILVILVTLPVVTYGCLRLREPPAPAVPENRTGAGETPGPAQGR